MQLRLIAVDKLRSRYIAEGCADFRKRLSSYYPFEEIEIKAADGSDERTAIQDESERIFKLLRPDDPVWLLERTGTPLSSEGLSDKVREIENSGATRLTFVVAGTYGTTAALRKRAAFLWSLSELTFLHEWARMFVLEQLYRSAKIARNEPYHH